jgi:hypothetical protein
MAEPLLMHCNKSSFAKIVPKSLSFRVLDANVLPRRSRIRCGRVGGFAQWTEASGIACVCGPFTGSGRLRDGSEWPML